MEFRTKLDGIVGDPFLEQAYGLDEAALPAASGAHEVTSLLEIEEHMSDRTQGDPRRVSDVAVRGTEQLRPA
jgi:hypothetical protein